MSPLKLFLTDSELTSDTFLLHTAELSQVSLIPYGAPQTGYKATKLHKIDDKVALPLLALMFSLLLGCGLFHVVYDWLGLKSKAFSMR